MDGIMQFGSLHIWFEGGALQPEHPVQPIRCRFSKFLIRRSIRCIFSDFLILNSPNDDSKFQYCQLFKLYCGDPPFQNRKRMYPSFRKSVLNYWWCPIRVWSNGIQFQRVFEIHGTVVLPQRATVNTFFDQFSLECKLQIEQVPKLNLLSSVLSTSLSYTHPLTRRYSYLHFHMLSFHRTLVDLGTYKTRGKKPSAHINITNSCTVELARV